MHLNDLIKTKTVKILQSQFSKTFRLCSFNHCRSYSNRSRLRIWVALVLNKLMSKCRLTH